MSEECRKHRIEAPIVAPSACASCELEKVRGDRYDFAVENERLRAELAALKAGQGEAVAHVTGAGYSGIDTETSKTEWLEISVLATPIRGMIPLGTKLYTAPPATGVIVPRELLEEVLQIVDRNWSGSGSSEAYAAQDIRALLAQSQGVKP